MTDPASSKEKRELLEAVIKINLAVVRSARGMMGNPGLQRPGIVHVKDKVADLSANGITELAHRTSTGSIQYGTWTTR